MSSAWAPGLHVAASALAPPATAAPLGVLLDYAAGGSYGGPIYTSIDDNPTFAGSPCRVAHSAAHLHQVEIDARTVAGVGVDINHIVRPQFGQWD